MGVKKKSAEAKIGDNPNEMDEISEKISHKGDAADNPRSGQEQKENG